jgi:hypothetical protein
MGLAGRGEGGLPRGNRVSVFVKNINRSTIVLIITPTKKFDDLSLKACKKFFIYLATQTS